MTPLRLSARALQPSNWQDAITKASHSDKFVGYRLNEKDLLKLVYQIKKSGKYHEMFWVSYLNQDFGLIVKKAPASRQRATDDRPADLVDPRVRDARLPSVHAQPQSIT